MPTALPQRCWPQADDESWWTKLGKLRTPVCGGGCQGTSRRAASGGAALPVLTSSCTSVQRRVVSCCVVFTVFRDEGVVAPSLSSNCTQKTSPVLERLCSGWQHLQLSLQETNISPSTNMENTHNFNFQRNEKAFQFACDMSAITTLYSLVQITLDGRKCERCNRHCTLRVIQNIHSHVETHVQETKHRFALPRKQQIRSPTR